MWTGQVFNRWSCGDSKSLSDAGILGNIQSDDGDGYSAAKCYADIGDNISDLKYFSVYFTNTFPADAVPISVKVYVDHEGPDAKTGNLLIHVSDDKSSPSWYTGGTGASDGNSGNVSWDDTERRYAYDVASDRRCASCGLRLLMTGN